MILAVAACNGGGGNDNGSDDSGAVPKGNRILEIQTSEPADGDFAGAFNLAQTVGMQSASLALDWNAIDIGVSYYPLENGLLQDPSVVAQHFSDLLALYPHKNLHFFQLGYPSGYYATDAYPEYAASDVTPVIGSSAMLQSDFIEAVFDSWDEYAGRINLIGFTWMHDETEADVAAIAADPAFGGLDDPPPDFVEFLRTLGLRTDAAADKPAWTTLANETAARGWSDTGFQLTCN
jgi:hypothetical protein